MVSAVVVSSDAAAGVGHVAVLPASRDQRPCPQIAESLFLTDAWSDRHWRSRRALGAGPAGYRLDVESLSEPSVQVLGCERLEVDEIRRRGVLSVALKPATVITDAGESAPGTCGADHVSV
ncbi:hypothetical protein GCM10020229_36480 [Kitasatospora albolonga]